MKLKANITRFAPRDGYICDAKKHDKAIEEEYEFFFISPGYFLCTTEEGDAYAISEYMQKIGCGCEDMTYNCKGKEVCKHLIKFMLLKEMPDKEIKEDMAQLLKAAGWSGTPLTPPDRPENRRRKPKLPNIKDPARKPGKKAAERAERRAQYEKMTPQQIIEGMDRKELEQNARRGAPMAIAELARREAEQAVSA